MTVALRGAAGGVDVGDAVHIALECDPVPRVPPMPEALRTALAADGRAKERWHSLPSSRRKEFLAYLDSLKAEEGLRRNVAEVLPMSQT